MDGQRGKCDLWPASKIHAMHREMQKFRARFGCSDIVCKPPTVLFLSRRSAFRMFQIVSRVFEKRRPKSPDSQSPMHRRHPPSVLTFPGRCWPFADLILPQIAIVKHDGHHYAYRASLLSSRIIMSYRCTQHNRKFTLLICKEGELLTYLGVLLTISSVYFPVQDGCQTNKLSACGQQTTSVPTNPKRQQHNNNNRGGGQGMRQLRGF